MYCTPRARTVEIEGEETLVVRKNESAPCHVFIRMLYA